MSVLKAEIRDSNLKAKQLRRSGIIPGVLYGSRDSEPINIQFKQNEVERFLRTNTIGAKVELVIGDKKQLTLLKEISYAPVGRKAEHLCFMPLAEDEKINNIAQIILLNKNKVTGNINQSLFEVSYKAYPRDLVDKIEIDMEGKKAGDSMEVSDLEISKNENIEILTPPDTVIYNITAPSKVEDTPETEEDQKITEETAE